jgi:hypothetical protein
MNFWNVKFRWIYNTIYGGYADFEKLLNKTYAAGYQDGLKEPRPAQVWMTSKRGFDTEPKVLSI